MTCDEVRGTFSDLYDEALSGARLVTITQHLASCPACRTEWASFRKAMQAVSELGGLEPSPGFAAQVRQQLETPTRWQRTIRWLFFPLHVKVPIQAMAMVLVAFAGLLLYQHAPELRGAIEHSSVPSPPAVREAPTPAPPAAGEGAVRRDNGFGPNAKAPRATRTESQTSPMAAGAPRSTPPSETKKDRSPSAHDEEAKEAGTTPMPAESAKTEESSREYRAKTMEPGVTPQTLRQVAPSPTEPGGAGAPAQASPKSLGAPPSAPGPGAAPTKEAQSSTLPGRSAEVLYATGVRDLADGKYERSIDVFRAFLAQYPQDARVPDARLRLGEAYLGLGRFSEAFQEFEAVVRQFPSSPLIPTALYLQAQARLAQGDRSGCQLLRDLSDRYPQASEAASSRQILSTRCR
jgi:tol-pal system protein YbgF